jgi:hypothetical protein
MESCPQVLRTVSGLHGKERTNELQYLGLEQRFSSREQRCRSSSVLGPADGLGSLSYAAPMCDLQEEGSVRGEAWLP